MRQWAILYNKEMVEMWRNYKWIWVPLVFLLLGIMQPITTYFMPELLEAAGGLPEGTVIEIPMPTGQHVLAQTLSQFGVMGVLILVLSMMSVVSGELNAGVAELIFVKPVTFVQFILAKWSGMITIMTAALVLSYMGAWYYTEQLIGPVSFDFVMRSLIIYWLWLVFVTSVTLLMSTWFRSFGAAAFITLGLIILLTVLTNFFTNILAWSPGRLPQFAMLDLQDYAADVPLLAVVTTTIICIAGCILLSVYLLRQKQSLA